MPGWVAEAEGVFPGASCGKDRAFGAEQSKIVTAKNKMKRERIGNMRERDSLYVIGPCAIYSRGMRASIRKAADGCNA